MVLSGEVQSETVRRWRVGLTLVVVVCAVASAISWALSLAYGEGLVTPVLLTLGTGCLAMARRTVPSTVTGDDRGSTGRSAAWVVAGVLLFLLAPLAVSALS